MSRPSVLRVLDTLASVAGAGTDEGCRLLIGEVGGWLGAFAAARLGARGGASAVRHALAEGARTAELAGVAS